MIVVVLVKAEVFIEGDNLLRYSTFMIEVGAARDSDLESVAFTHRRAFLDTYPGATEDLTPEAVEYHVSGDWHDNQVESYREALDNGTVMHVARVGRAAIGFCAFDPGSDGGEVKGAGLYIDPDYQRRGVGSALVYSLGELFSRGALIRSVPGTHAMAFYEKLGYKPTGYEYEEYPQLKGGQELPQMQLRISPEDARFTLERLRERFEGDADWRFV